MTKSPSSQRPDTDEEGHRAGAGAETGGLRVEEHEGTRGVDRLRQRRQAVKLRSDRFPCHDHHDRVARSSPRPSPRHQRPAAGPDRHVAPGSAGGGSLRRRAPWRRATAAAASGAAARLRWRPWPAALVRDRASSAVTPLPQPAPVRVGSEAAAQQPQQPRWRARGRRDDSHRAGRRRQGSRPRSRSR